MFAGGEEHWQHWSWKVRTGVSGMYSGLAEVMKTTEAKEGHGVQKILKDNAELVNVGQTTCTKARREEHSMLAEYTRPEAATIGRSVSDRS